MSIISEKSPNYRGIHHYKFSFKIDRYGFVHFFINHKLEFVSQVSKEIHTNTIENLWSHVKRDLKRTRITSKYMLAIARFYFHRTLSKEEQMSLLIKG